jgi:hypothetical protein
MKVHLLLKQKALLCDDVIAQAQKHLNKRWLSDTDKPYRYRAKWLPYNGS